MALIATETKASGPLFAKPDLLEALVRASNQAERVLGPAVRAAYSGGIVRRGPGRFGHVADLWRTQTAVTGFNVTTRVFPQGKGAFKALFLEQGHRGPHRGGLQRVGPRDRRDRAARRRGHAAALALPGGIFRRYVQPFGAPAFHVLERVLDAQWPRVQPLFGAELGKELGA